jgi:hypothetical protein
LTVEFSGGISAANSALQIDENDKAFTNHMFKGVFGNQFGRFDNMTPFITGRSIFIPMRMAAYMDDKLKVPTNIFKKLCMFYVKSITGFSDRQVGTVEIDTGIENTKTELPSSQTAATRELTFQFGPELTGQFISKYVRLWIDGVIDPLTHDATYHGSALDYKQTNHTMEGLYIVLDPTRTKVQFHAYLSNMFPKSAPGSLNDSTVGEHNMFDPSIPFTVTSYENIPAIGAFISANFNFKALAMTSTSTDATTLTAGTASPGDFISAAGSYLGEFQKSAT